MSAPLPPAPRRFTTLEAGRALAAAAVALHHATLLIAQPRYLGAYAFAGAPVFLNAGVDFFFVLSGFVIAWAHAGDLGRPERLPRYAELRFTRIYPLYWAVLVPLVAIYAAVPGFGVPRQHDWGYVASSFLLLPMPDQPVLGVAWSLTYEVVFYVLFAGAVLGGRRVLWLATAWAAAIVAANLLGLARDYPASFLLSPHDLQFLLGLAVALVLRRARAPEPRLWLAAGAAGLLATVFWAEPRGFDDPLGAALALGASSAALVAGAVELERSGALRAPGWLVWAGGASYAVYLVHVVAQSFSVRVLLRLHLAQPEALACTLAGVGIGAGLLCHVWIERPLLRRVRGRLRPFAATPAPEPAG